jgi:hypothetical protein
MELIQGPSAPEVWLGGARHLAASAARQDFDVFLHIATPTVLSARDLAVLRRVDHFLTSHRGLPVNTVAETIFPLEDYLRGGAKEVFEVYPARMAEIHHARSDRRWDATLSESCVSATMRVWCSIRLRTSSRR